MSASRAGQRLSRWLPMLRWVPHWRTPGTVQADLLAGLTGAVVVLPQGIAFATLAGMPPQYGLYAAMLPCIVAALFGASRLMVSGPANAISLTTLALLGPLAEPGSARYVELAVTLAFLVGLVQIVLGAVRAGRLVDYVPHSVIVGFTAGAAVLIAAAQLAPFTGIALPRGLPIWEVLAGLWERRETWQPLAVVAGAVTFVTIRLAAPLNRKVPALLVGVLVGCVVAALLQLMWPDEPRLKAVPPLPDVLPDLSMPDLSWATVRSLWLSVLIMTLLGLTEALAIARAVAGRDRESLDGSREFIGQGLANLVGGLTSSYPISGSFNRSGVNIVSGARTPLAAASSAVFLIALLWMLAPYARLLPFAVVSGLLFMVAWGLIDRREIARIWREEPTQRLPMAVTWIATVTVSLEWAILLGLAVAGAGALLRRRTAR